MTLQSYNEIAIFFVIFLVFLTMINTNFFKVYRKNRLSVARHKLVY